MRQGTLERQDVQNTGGPDYRVASPVFGALYEYHRLVPEHPKYGQFGVEIRLIVVIESHPEYGRAMFIQQRDACHKGDWAAVRTSATRSITPEYRSWQPVLEDWDKEHGTTGGFELVDESQVKVRWVGPKS